MTDHDIREPENLTIRRMGSSDLDAVTLLEQRVFPDPWPKAAFEQDLEGDNHGVLLAEIDGRLCGYACYMAVAGEAHLTNIAVAPEFRGKSIAKILLNRILDIAKKVNCEYIFLDVRPSNEAAISLYKKYGFIELYQRPKYYRSPVEDALVMVKTLRDEQG